MPFKGMMQLPTELTLRSTKEGPRLFSRPVKETEQLFTSVQKETNLTTERANQMLAKYSEADGLRLKATIKLSHATTAGLNLFGQRIVDYDLNYNKLNGMFYSPNDPTSMEISADIYIDKTSMEVFIDGGAYSYYLPRKVEDGNKEGFHFWGNNIEVTDLEILKVQSIWN